VFCTETARDSFMKRHPRVTENQMCVVENGFDEEIFADVEASLKPRRRAPDEPLVLLHSGILYTSTDRNPEGLLEALRMLIAAEKIAPHEIRVILRASGYEKEYRRMIDQRALGSIVTLEPSIGYREALAEMLSADGLLLFQGYTSNPAVPAKAYEYLRAKRPVFALVDSEGETAKLVRKTGVGRLAPLDDPVRIAEELQAFMRDLREDRFTPMSASALEKYSRRGRAAELAAQFDGTAAQRQGLRSARP
jgi:hypothetical protein